MNIDWPTIILNLRVAGWSHKRIAREIGAGQTTVSHWARGTSTPRDLHHTLRLLDLHYDECQDRHDRRLVA